MEVMDGAPASWNTVLTTQLYDTALDFQSAIRFHKDTLMRLDNYQRTDYLYWDFSRDNNLFCNARSNLVGWTEKMEPPKFPKDDSNVLKKATPKQKGARPCRHCGSDQHWDLECKHSYRGNHSARSNLTHSVNEEQAQVQERYKDLYYELGSDDDELAEPSEKDFCEPLQLAEESLAPARMSRSYLTVTSELKGESTDPRTPEVAIANRVKVDTSIEQFSTNKQSPVISAMPSTQVSTSQTFGFNRRSRRRLARDVHRTSYAVHQGDRDEPPLLELTKVMARPPGCSFLGSKAIKVLGVIGEPGDVSTEIIVDSESDIMLISEETWKELRCRPKIRTGQRVNLVQVTGTSTILGYITVDLFFETMGGTVKMNVEAYVVKGMTTPFILGNDFADQYSISILRKDEETTLIFGDSNREVKVENSTGSSLINEEGHAFRIRTSPGLSSRTVKGKLHRRNQKLKRKTQQFLTDNTVRASKTVVIPAGTSAPVPVKATFPILCDSLFIEKNIDFANTMMGIVATTDTLISWLNPFVRVDNFTDNPVKVPAGQSLGRSHNPNNWLVRHSSVADADYAKLIVHAALLRTLAEAQSFSHDIVSFQDQVNPVKIAAVRSHTSIQSKAQWNATEPDDPLATEPVEGGPKMAELPEDPVETGRILEVLDLSPDLTAEQRSSVERIILKNLSVFALDG